jgi:ABC-type transporter Mla MlaB component
VEATKPIVLVVTGRLSPGDVGPLCDELTLRLLEAAAAEVICDVSRLGRPTLATVDSLARLQLTARRQGRRIRLRGAGRELRLLLDLAGLGNLAENGFGSP